MIAGGPDKHRETNIKILSLWLCKVSITD